MKLDWNDELNVGVERFDLQHKEILSKVKDIYRELESGNDREKQNENIAALLSLAENHFRDEEASLEGKDYPDMFDHLDEHKNLLMELTTIRDLHKNGQIEIDEEIIGFLANWLIVHTQETDRGYIHLFT